MMDQMESTGNRITITQDRTVSGMPWILNTGISTNNNVAHHEIPLTADYAWIYVDNKEYQIGQRPIGRIGGTNDDRYSIAVYGKLTADSTPEFDDDDRMIFGSWVNDGMIVVDNTNYVPALTGVGKMSLDEKIKADDTPAVTYRGKVAAMKEHDMDHLNAYSPEYIPLSGDVVLTANFASMQGDLSGSITFDSEEITLDSKDLENYAVTEGRASINVNAGTGTGTWNAGFVHDGLWIVGDFEVIVNPSHKMLEDPEENQPDVQNNYERYTGAFGAVEQSGS